MRMILLFQTFILNLNRSKCVYNKNFFKVKCRFIYNWSSFINTVLYNEFKFYFLVHYSQKQINAKMIHSRWVTWVRSPRNKTILRSVAVWMRVLQTCDLTVYTSVSLTRQQQGEQAMDGWLLFFGILWPVLDRWIPMIIWAALITHCRALLSWAGHVSCHFAIFPNPEC